METEWKLSSSGIEIDWKLSRNWMKIDVNLNENGMETGWKLNRNDSCGRWVEPNKMVLCPLEGWSLEVGEGWTDVGWEKGQQDASSNKKNVDPLNQKTYRGRSAWRMWTRWTKKLIGDGVRGDPLFSFVVSGLWRISAGSCGPLIQ